MQNHEEVVEYEFTPDELVELQLLRDIEIDALVDAGHLPDDARMDELLREQLCFRYPEMELYISTGAPYPAGDLFFEIKNISLPRAIVDYIRHSLRVTCAKSEGENCIENWCRRFDDDSCGDGVFEAEMVVLQLVDETVVQLEGYRRKQAERTGGGITPGDATVDIRKLKWIQDLSSTSLRLDISTVADTAYSLLGKTAQEVCQMVPEWLRVLHCESVLRTDMAERVLRRQNEMINSLKGRPISELRRSIPHNERSGFRGGNEAEAMARYLCTPRVSFHGTQRHRVGSIVRHGFLMPGAINPMGGGAHVVRCGSTYGRGIYSSPNPWFSMSYSGWGAFPTQQKDIPGMKLIVCAVIMGRTANIYRDDDWRLQNKPYPGADSHVGNNQFEYIVFDNAQIIPCYVIHLDWGSHEKNLECFENIPEDPSSWIKRNANRPHPKLSQDNSKTMAPGDKQRAKEALMAKAAKYFPYGYGAAQGTKFVVEDVAEVSEDEEDYGEYSYDRLEGVDFFADKNKQIEEASFWAWDGHDLPGFTQVDQYTEDRIAKTKKHRAT